MFSTIEATKYLLQHGCSYIPTEKINHDSLEEHFWITRTVNRCSDNPSIYQLGFSENVVRIKQSVSPVFENPNRKCGNNRQISRGKVDNTPVEKITKVNEIYHFCNNYCLKLLNCPFINFVPTLFVGEIL